MQYNSDFRYDLKRGNDAEKWFGGLLTGGSIECKRDFKAHKTKNVFVEYECRGKPSGIETTEAEYWVFIVGPHDNDLRAYLTTTERLRVLYQNALKSQNVRPGGDKMLSMGALVKGEDLVA